MGALLQQLRTTPVNVPVCAFAPLKNIRIDIKAYTNTCKNLVNVFMEIIY